MYELLNNLFCFLQSSALLYSNEIFCFLFCFNKSVDFWIICLNSERLEAENESFPVFTSGQAYPGDKYHLGKEYLCG